MRNSDAMAAKRTRPASPLVNAAQAFDDELASYAHLSDLVARAPLTTTKQLDRVNETLNAIVACEDRLRGAGQRLSDALTAARERQDQHARILLERLPLVEERNRRLRELFGQFNALGADVAALNASASQLRPDAAAAPSAAVRDVSRGLLALSERARALADVAHQAQFDELASQVHSLHQRLLAACKKLERAPGGA